MNKILILAVPALLLAGSSHAQKGKKPARGGRQKPVVTENTYDSGFTKTKTGLMYKIVKDAPGTQKAALGDFMEFHISTRMGDSVLFDSRKMNNNMPVPYQVAKPAFGGDLSEGLMMLTTGDSAVFLVSVDSVLKMGGQALPWMKAGEDQKLQYEIAVTKVQTAAQQQAEKKAMAGKQVEIDEKLLQDYFKANNLKPMKTPAGLYYTITEKGKGVMPKTGDKVTMNYTGTTMDGKIFDSNVDPAFSHVQPFTFGLGQGQVIKGWDEGIALMPVGTKGVLYIPSTMAYGERSPSAAIPPNAVLIFDVEVVSIEDKK